MNPLFSIVIPTYNRPDLLQHAIQSVLDQTVNDWELIIVGDGVAQETENVVNSYTDKRITYIYQEHQHTSVAKNNGVAHAHGRYICFLDDDDRYCNNHLERLQEAIKKRNYPVAFFYTGVYELSNSEPIHRRELAQTPIKNGVEHVLMNTIIPSSSCLHRDIFRLYQFKTEDLPAEDRALWIQVTSKFPVYQVSAYTVAHLKHKRQYTAAVSEQLSFDVMEGGISSIRQLLKEKEIKEKVSKPVAKRFLSRSYYWYMFDALKNKDRKKAFRLLFKSIWERPSLLFTKKLIAALRSIIFIGKKGSI